MNSSLESVRGTNAKPLLFDRVKIETEYYAQEFEYAHLSIDRDDRWLKSVARCNFDDNWLQYINTKLVGIGSAELDWDNADLHPAIINARHEFYEEVLGWADEDSPLYDTYAEYNKRAEHPEAPATLISVFRRIDEHGFDVAEKLIQVPRLFTVCKSMYKENSEPDDVAERINQINKAVDKLLIKPVVVRRRTTLPAHKRRLSDSKMIVNGRAKLMPSEALVEKHTPHLLEVGFSQEQIDKNAYMLIRQDPADIDTFLKLFADHGLDGIKMLSGHLKGLDKVEVAEARMVAMEAMGLHVPSVLNGYTDALAIKPEMIADKMPVISTFLDAVKSDIPVINAVNESPKLLARSPAKFLAVAGVLENSTDMTGQHIRHVEPYVRNSLDLVFAALVRSRQEDRMVQANDINKTAWAIPADERRSFNLDALQDVLVRSLLATRAITSYLNAVPLTDQEKITRPDLEYLV